MNIELNAIPMPNGVLQLEWNEVPEPATKSQELLQKEIYRRFKSDLKSFLLFLSFLSQSISLSPSLDYWRIFTGRFANKLSHIPDLETIRYAVTISEDEDISEMLSRAPLMPGAEYLNAEFHRHKDKGPEKVGLGKDKTPKTKKISVKTKKTKAKTLGEAVKKVSKKKDT